MKNSNTLLFLLIGCTTLIIISIISIFLGAAQMPPQDVYNAIFNFDPTNTYHHVIRELRLPRVIAAIFVGASLSVSGAIMQGITKNPIADSGLLGINAGAAFALALSFAFLNNLSYSLIIIISFLGAAFSTAIVYLVTSYNRAKVSPVRLVLAGLTVSIFFSSLSQAISIHFNVGQNVMFWTVGTLAGSNFTQLRIVVPWVSLALILSIVLSHSISVLSLGEEVAKGLGLKVELVRALSLIVVLILSGGAVVVGGTISFVGVITPHIVSYFVGSDYRKIIPCSIVYGAIFMVIADIIARMINIPHETPVGLIFSIIGVPFFLYISRKERRMIDA